MDIIKGRIATAIKTVIYGPEGIGKSTFAAQFPDPLFIDTEGSTVHMDVKRLPKPDLWVELLNEVEYVRQNPGCCKTLVLDTADWAETLCSEYVCNRDQKTGIEDYGYGKGYRYNFEEFGRLLNALELVRGQGVNVVICCHATIRKFEQPDELGAYDRWGLKLTDAPKASIAGMVKEWADMVIFANYKTIVVNVDGKGATKGKNKVQGGKRVMYMTHNACWDAKNRFGLPDEADFSYEVVRDVIEGGASAPVQTTAKTPSAGTGQENPSALSRAVERAATPTQPTTEPTQPAQTQTPPEAVKGPQEDAQSGAGNSSANVPEAGQAASTANVGMSARPQGGLRAQAQSAQPQDAPETRDRAERQARGDAQYAGLPDALVRMMQEAGVTPGEVRYVIAQKGIYPANTPWAVLCENEQFMKGWLMHPQVWPKVVEMAIQNRENDPF